MNSRSALFLALAASSANAACPSPSCYVPTSGALNASDFSAWLVASAGSGLVSLQLAPGSYTLAAPTAGVRASLVLPTLSDVSIDCTGVTLTAESRTAPGIYAANWAGVAISGLSLRFAEPPSNTAVIVAVDTATSTLDVAVEQGHPAEDWVAGTVASCNVFEPQTRLRLPLAQDIYISAIAPSPSGGGLFRVTVANVGQLERVAAGHLLGCRVPNGGMTFQLDGAIQCTVSDVTLYGGPCFGYFETGGSGNTWRHITITYPDPPPGATTRPLLSTSADGMHSVGTRVGPQVDGAHFEGMDDDGIAVHGSFSLVTDAAVEAGLVWVADHGAIAVGDRVSLYDPIFGPAPAPAPPGFAATSWKVMEVTKAAPGYRPPANISKTMPSQKLPGASYSVLTLSMGGPPLPTGLAFDWVLVNTDAVGRGYSIRNSVIRNHRARGLLLKGTDGLVENTTITNSSLGGIIVTPELYWEEAGYARNVTIRNNTITLTSSGAQSYGGIALGAVAPDGGLATQPGHAAVTIEGNVLVDCGYAPIWLNAAGNVMLRGNTLVTPFHAANASQLPGCCEPLPAQKIAVYAQSVRSLTVAGNCVRRAPAGASALQFLLNVTADCDGQWAGGVVDCE